MPEPALIFVDLIEEAPQTAEQFYTQHPGKDVDDIKALYRKYRKEFQPWRVLILSGDNHEPLFRSTERYFNQADARNAIDLAFGTQSNVYLRQAEHGDIELRLAQENTE